MREAITKNRVRDLLAQGPKSLEALMMALNCDRRRVHSVVYLMPEVIRVDLTPERGPQARPVYGLIPSLTKRTQTAS